MDNAACLKDTWLEFKDQMYGLLTEFLAYAGPSLNALGITWTGPDEEVSESADEIIYGWYVQFYHGRLNVGSLLSGFAGSKIQPLIVGGVHGMSPNRIWFSFVSLPRAACPLSDTEAKDYRKRLNAWEMDNTANFYYDHIRRWMPEKRWTPKLRGADLGVQRPWEEEPLSEDEPEEPPPDPEPEEYEEERTISYLVEDLQDIPRPVLERMFRNIEGGQWVEIEETDGQGVFVIRPTADVLEIRFYPPGTDEELRDLALREIGQDPHYHKVIPVWLRAVQTRVLHPESVAALQKGLKEAVPELERSFAHNWNEFKKDLRAYASAKAWRPKPRTEP